MAKKAIKITVITGTTASGKTKMAIDEAIKNNAEIIYADSRAVYCGFDIVSAKPTLHEQKIVPHHLIDIIEPDCTFSAGDFVRLAQEKIEDITARGKNVIICGGTWFYIKSLLDDCALPEIKRNEKLRNELCKLNCEELHKMLSLLDFKRAQIVNINDKEKIIRSIEMCKYLNMPLSEFVRKDNKKYDAKWVVLVPLREKLYEKINARVDLMAKEGLHSEFLKMVEKWGQENAIIKNTIGYKEFFECESEDIAIEKIKQHTRNFAKRQMTFFRSLNV